MDLFIWHIVGSGNYSIGTINDLKSHKKSINDPEDLMILYKFQEADTHMAYKIWKELNQAADNLNEQAKLAG